MTKRYGFVDYMFGEKVDGDYVGYAEYAYRVQQLKEMCQGMLRVANMKYQHQAEVILKELEGEP